MNIEIQNIQNTIQGKKTFELAKIVRNLHNCNDSDLDVVYDLALAEIKKRVPASTFQKLIDELA